MSQENDQKIEEQKEKKEQINDEKKEQINDKKNDEDNNENIIRVEHDMFHRNHLCSGTCKNPLAILRKNLESCFAENKFPSFNECHGKIKEAYIEWFKQADDNAINFMLTNLKELLSIHGWRNQMENNNLRRYLVSPAVHETEISNSIYNIIYDIMCKPNSHLLNIAICCRKTEILANEASTFQDKMYGYLVAEIKSMKVIGNKPAEILKIRVDWVSTSAFFGQNKNRFSLVELTALRMFTDVSQFAEKLTKIGLSGDCSMDCEYVMTRYLIHKAIYKLHLLQVQLQQKCPAELYRGVSATWDKSIKIDSRISFSSIISTTTNLNTAKGFCFGGLIFCINVKFNNWPYIANVALISGFRTEQEWLCSHMKGLIKEVKEVKLKGDTIDYTTVKIDMD